MILLTRWELPVSETVPVPTAPEEPQASPLTARPVRLALNSPPIATFDRTTGPSSGQDDEDGHDDCPRSAHHGFLVTDPDVPDGQLDRRDF